MTYVISCISDAHDRGLLFAAACVCFIGVYASFAIAQHSALSQGAQRQHWAIVGIGAAAATAWATHMIGLLAFRPGLMFAFDPILMVLSLLAAAVGIALGMWISIGQHDFSRRFAGGIVIGIGITVLHYLGQASYLVRAETSFDVPLVIFSALVGLAVFGLALAMSGVRRKPRRIFAAPLLVLAIAILHFGGMTALHLTANPTVQFPAYALPAGVVAPMVATVASGLLALACLGLRFSITAARQRRGDMKRLAELANMTVEGIAVCSDGSITSINASLRALSGHSLESAHNLPMSSLLTIPNIESLPLLEEHDAQLIRMDGERVPVRILRSAVTVGSKTQTVIAVRDQRERMRTESKMRALAYTDTLTGLPNRLSVVEMMQDLAIKAASSEDRYALLLLDLDRFKWVNDTMGHFVGDMLLRQTAARLRAEIASKDFVGRLGGDEFAVLVRGNETKAANTAQRLLEAMSLPFVISDHVVEVRASIGIAMSGVQDANHEVLTRNADLALYRVKEDAGAAFKFFEPSMHERAQRRRRLELDLRQAVMAKQFEVHYQPQVDPVTRRIAGAEALIRWNHPQHGMVPPDQFIPLSEEVGLIAEIGEWVLRKACEDARAWPVEMSLAVNLSAVQLRRSDLADMVQNALRTSGLRPQRLELEVTETSLMQDDETTYENLRKLQAFGVRVSLDDFGTGYSSLSYLRQFPFDKLKIDRSFVRNIPESKDSLAIVQAIIKMASDLRMTITIEGVETEEQMLFAAENRCDQVQGFLVSRPIPSEALSEFISASSQQKLIA